MQQGRRCSQLMHHGRLFLPYPLSIEPTLKVNSSSHLEFMQYTNDARDTSENAAHVFGRNAPLGLRRVSFVHIPRSSETVNLACAIED